MTEQDEMSLLNVFDVETDEGMRRMVGFVDPSRVSEDGIPTRSVVGAFTPMPNDEFDPETFVANPEFLAAFAEFMDLETRLSEEIVRQAEAIPGKWLYIVDPRNTTPEEEDPPQSDVIGCFAVDDSGRITPGSFLYNDEHRLFCPDAGTSGVLMDGRFFDWLNS
jgi:hypothetical protein